MPKIGVVLALDGEAKFSQAMKNAQQAASRMDSALKDLKAEYKDNAQSAEALEKQQEALKKQQEAYNRLLTAAKTGQSNAKKAYKEQADALDDLEKELKEAEKALSSMNKEADPKAYADQEKAVADLAKAVDKQTTNYLKAEGRLASWDAKVEKAESSVKKNSAALDKNESELREVRTAADRASDAVDDLGDSMDDASKNAKEGGSGLKSFISSIPAALAIKGVDLAGDAIMKLKDKAIEAAKYVVKVGSEFESAMSKVQALSGASSSQLQQISDKAKELGGSTKFSATEVADAFSYMSLAGWNTEQMLSAIDGVVNLAAASEMDLAQASDMVTDYLSAFGLEASDSIHMVDALTYAQTHSNTSTEQLGEAFANCAADMHASGQDMETTTAMLEAMANQGTKGAKAGTALSAMMRDISQKMKDGKIQIGDTSVAVKDQEGNFRDLTDIMRDVEAATDGMGDADKRAALQKTFTARSLSAVNEVLTEGVDKIAGYEEQLRSADGTAAEVATTMQNNLQGKLTEMNSAAEGLGVALYEQVKGPLTSGVELATGLLNGLTDIIKGRDDEVSALLKNTQSARQELEKSLETARGIVSDAEDNAGRVEILGRQLINLNEKEELSIGQRQRLKTIVDELAKSIPEIADAYDEETGKVNLTSEAITALIESKRSLMIINAQEAAAQELINQQMEAMIALEEGKAGLENLQAKQQLYVDIQDALGDMVDAEREAGDGSGFYSEREKLVKLLDDALNKGIITIDEYNEAMDDFGDIELGNGEEAWADWTAATEKAADKAYDAAEAVDKEAKAVDELQKVSDEATAEAESYSAAAAKAADALLEQSENSKEAADSTNDLKDSVDKASSSEEGLGEAASAAAEIVSEAHEKAAERIKDAYDDAAKSAADSFKVNLYDDAENWGGEDATVETMLANLRKQQEAYLNYQQNLETIKEHVGKEIAPEMYKYLLESGEESANAIQHIVNTLNDQSEELDANGLNAKVKEFSDAFMEGLGIQDQISSQVAADIVALQAGFGEFASSAEEWANLGQIAGQAIAAAGADISSETVDAFNQAAETARACGVAIPEGLAAGIESAEDPAAAIEDATSKLNDAIQGQAEGLMALAQEKGLEIPPKIAEGISSGGQAAIDAYNELLTAVSGIDSGEVAQAGAQAGEELSTSTANSIEGGSDEISSATESMLKGAADAATGSASVFHTVGEEIPTQIVSGAQSKESIVLEKGKSLMQKGVTGAKGIVNQMRSAGESGGSNMAAGMNSKAGAMNSAGASLGRSGMSGASSQTSGFNSVGVQMASGIASGMASQISRVAEQAANIVRNALNRAKAEAQIQSPSKVFRDQVGKQLAAGVAFGIKLGTKDTEDAAKTMVNSTLAAATNWLASRAGTTADEVSYAYGKLNETLLKNMFGVSKTKTTGTGKNQKTTTKTNDEYYGDVLKAAENYYSNLEKLQDVSTKEELAYWTAVRAKLKAGTQAWIDATDKIRTLQANIGTYDVADNLLSQLETYYDMSEKAVMDYWDRVRKQYAAGTADRINADKKYFEAKKAYTDRLKDIEDDYQKRIEDANEKYKKQVEDRKKQISDAFGLFDEFESESVSGEKLLFNIQSQAAGYEDWSKQLDELAKRGILSEELLQELRDQGPEQTAAIHALNSLTDKQLKQYQEAYQKKMDAAQAQATKENAVLQALIKFEIRELKKQQADDLAKVNTGLNTNVASLASSIKNIADDMVNKLVAAITSGKSSSQISSATNEIINPAGASMSSGGSTKTAAPAAAPAASAKTGYGSNSAIDAAIKAAPNHSKTLSAAEKKSHVELWQYLATKYGKAPNTSTYIALGKALGVKTGTTASTITSAQKAEILKLLKQKGYASGSSYIPRSGYIWMDEAGAGSEMILRQADNARLAYAQRGDAVVPAASTANLWKWSQIDPASLESVAALNAQLAQAFQVYASTSGQQSGILSQMCGLLQQMMPYVMQDRNTYLDGRKISEGTVDYTSRELAMRDRRRR